MSDDGADRVAVVARSIRRAGIAVVVLAISTGWLGYRQSQSEERRCAWTRDDVDSLLWFAYESDHPRPPGLEDSPEVLRHDDLRINWREDILVKWRERPTTRPPPELH